MTSPATLAAFVGDLVKADPGIPHSTILEKIDEHFAEINFTYVLVENLPLDPSSNEIVTFICTDYQNAGKWFRT